MDRRKFLGKSLVASAFTAFPFSLQASFNKKKIGNHSFAVCFSFHPVKIITSAEGGAISTNDKKIYETIRILRGHGLLRESGNKKFENKVKKKYVAIIKGHLKKTIKVNTLIDKHFIDQSKSFVNSDNGKEAISSFKLKKLLNSSCFVEIDIFTGRTHQIRVQSSHIGHPILNDAKYGDKNFNKTISPKKIKRMALHSSEIRFVDQDGIKIHAKSEIDEAFTILLDTLK